MEMQMLFLGLCLTSLTQEKGEGVWRIERTNTLL